MRGIDSKVARELLGMAAGMGGWVDEDGNPFVDLKEKRELLERTWTALEELKEKDAKKESKMKIEGVAETIKVLHCKRDRSNKVYILIVLKRPDGKHEAIGFYGKRKKLAEHDLAMDSKGCFGGFWQAVEALEKVYREKVDKKRYISVDSSVYFEKEEPVTMEEAREFLRSKGIRVSDDPHEEKPRKSRRKAKPVIEPKEEESEEIVVVCLDNTGLEDQFDRDVEYVGRMADDDGKLIVENKFGEEKECFAQRFKVVG